MFAYDFFLNFHTSPLTGVLLPQPAWPSQLRLSYCCLGCGHVQSLETVDSQPLISSPSENLPMLLGLRVVE